MKVTSKTLYKSPSEGRGEVGMAFSRPRGKGLRPPAVKGKGDKRNIEGAGASENYRGKLLKETQKKGEGAGKGGHRCGGEGGGFQGEKKKHKGKI